MGEEEGEKDLREVHLLLNTHPTVWPAAQGLLPHRHSRHDTMLTHGPAGPDRRGQHGEKDRRRDSPDGRRDRTDWRRDRTA